MKRVISALCVFAALATLSGCSTTTGSSASTSSRRTTTTMSEPDDEPERTIEEVDQYGISLDEVDELCKKAIRKHNMKSEYREDFNKAEKDLDKVIDKVLNKKTEEYKVDDLLSKYDAACEACYDYLDSCVNIESLYYLYNSDNELNRKEKDGLRVMLTLFINPLNELKKSQEDMQKLLTSAIEEGRELTDEEITSVEEIYQVLIDKAYMADTAYL